MTEEKSFRDKWYEAVDRKGSILCAGLDPAVYEMGRGEKGLPQGASKLRWSLRYLDAVASYSAAVKLNTNYLEGKEDNENSRKIVGQSHDLGLVAIEDSKRRDIGDTNDAGLFYAQQKGYDAVTFSPFAGNIEEAVKQAHSRGLGLISMCIMSNPEFEREKRKLVPLTPEDVKELNDPTRDRLVYLQGQAYMAQYEWLAHTAKKSGADGIVVGAPSKKNHITEEEISRVKSIVGEDMLILVPGVGAQGGELNLLTKYFHKKDLIVNVSRDLMLPKGMNSTPKNQREAAEKFRDMLMA